MRNKLYTFNRDVGGPSGYILMKEFDRDGEVVRVHEHSGVEGDELWSKLRGVGDRLYPDIEKIMRAPTMEEYGTTNKLDYLYRARTGQFAANFADFEAADRIWRLDMPHLAWVLEFAIQRGQKTIDNLYKALAYLACREDEVIVVSRDSDLSFFWQTVTAAEHAVAKEAARFDRSKYEIPRSERTRYCGGLIISLDHNTGAYTWNVHT